MSGRNCLPVLADLNKANSGMTNTITRGNFFVGASVCSDRLHLTNRKLVTRVALSCQMSAIVSVLCHHVFHVISLGAKKKVVGINTRGSITLMQDAHSNGDFSPLLRPDNARNKPVSTTKSFHWVSHVISGVRCANVASVLVFNPFNWFGIPSSTHSVLQYVKTLFARRAAKISRDLADWRTGYVCNGVCSSGINIACS